MQKYIITGCLVLFLSSCSGTMPDNLGVNAGKLIECPGSPNCVNTQSTVEAEQMSPLSYSGSMADAKAKLIKVIEGQGRTKIVKQTDSYIHAEFKTKIMRFVDDVEFYFDDTNKQIHFRSASRLGHSDLGLNRERMENITSLFK